MNCEQARELMSDYLEQYLAEPEAGLLTEHLADCGACRAELAELEETLDMVHELPREEPSPDLWQEFAPKFAEIRAEMRLSLPERIGLYFACLFSALREGWMMFAVGVHNSWSGNAQPYI